ncbi:hypothetical protein FHS43_004452 [Streptosporangium becharense]|uniref:Uncharacterized protein n=1 Tax=Streptosporangium becharense TaxID=1816182 RepID=A0A7W9IK24_9ACTN|nr:hypothetical protein [Streptosporangium becharense]MBB2913154.1 hypothetical protein [Streptosporangium becharense]MBB5822137.1 hypothetical protein [Streptosporangium becharense]
MSGPLAALAIVTVAFVVVASVVEWWRDRSWMSSQERQVKRTWADQARRVREARWPDYYR